MKTRNNLRGNDHLPGSTGIPQNTAAPSPENLSEAIFECTPCPMVILGTDHTVLKINQAFKDLFGYNSDEIIGQDIDIIVTSEETFHSARKITNIVESGETIKFQSSRIKKDGTAIPVEITGLPVRADGGQTVILGVYRDLSIENEAKGKLAELAIIYKSLFDNSPIAMLDLDFSRIIESIKDFHTPASASGENKDFTLPHTPTDLQSRIKLHQINQAAKDLFGTKYEEEVIQALSNRNNVLGASLIKSIHILLSGKNESEQEIPLRPVAGTERRVRLKVVLAPGHEHDFSRVFVSIEDMTGHNIAETHLIKALSMMEKEAQLDPLTTLLNRREVQKLFSLHASPSESQITGLGIALLDLDNLKTINDTYGHNYGDLALTRLAEGLKRSCRQDDVIGRWGGDEFIFIARVDNPEILSHVLKRLHKKLTDETFEIPGGEKINLSITVGATYKTLDTLHHTSLEEIIEEADKALYLGKWQGRNQLMFAWNIEDQPK